MAFTFKHGDRPLEGYTIQRAVGRGGFGEVYYAVSDGGREVALKYLRDNPEIELRGVTACMNLKSPHLVTVFDVKKSAEGDYFIVMEYVSGPSLRDLLVAEPSGIGPQKAAFFLREIAKGLAYLHDRGIVHRDLKPGNIFYEDGYVQIGDYGLSKFISISRHSAQTSSVGTVHYMAPEVGSGNYSRGVDIYALGVILYEMLLGKVPFEGSSLAEVLMKHLTEQPEIDELPKPFGQVIRKSLAKDPNDRYQTVDEMVEELLGVEDVKQSVVGFNPVSLSGVVRREVGDLADSPVPSPNPPRPVVPPPVPPVPAASPAPAGAAPLTDRLAERFNRVSQKLDKKAHKLGSPPLQPAPPAAPPPPSPVVTASERTQRIVLTVILLLGMATGVGLIGGQNAISGETAAIVGISSFLLAAAGTISVVLWGWLTSVKLSSSNPNWALRLILMGCCLPVMSLAAAPMIAGTRYDEKGAMVLTALLASMLVGNWRDRLRRGSQGNLEAGRAIGLALFAGIFAAILDAEWLAWSAAGVAAAISLSVQSLAWAFPSISPRRPIGPAGTTVAAAACAPECGPTPVPLHAAPAGGEAPQQHYQGLGPTPTGHEQIPMGIPVHERYRGALRASTTPLAAYRSAFARGFWSLVAFLLAGGTIVLFITPLVVDLERVNWYQLQQRHIQRLDQFEQVYYRDTGTLRRVGPIGISAVPPGASLFRKHVDRSDLAGVVTGCIACFSFMIFSLRKTTQRRRPGFWRETVRPFLLAAAMTGLGAAITCFATVVDTSREDEVIPTIVGLVFSALLFLVLLFVRGRRARHPLRYAAQAGMPAGPGEAPWAIPVQPDASAEQNVAVHYDRPGHNPDA